MRRFDRRLGLLVACGALVAGAAACGSGSSSGSPARSSTTAPGGTTATVATAPPTTAPGAGPAPSAPGGQLTTVEQQLASVPGLLNQARNANSAADPDQARAAEGG